LRCKSAHQFVRRGAGGQDALLVFGILAGLVVFEQRQAAHNARLDAFKRLDEPRTWWEGARNRARQTVAEDQP
jgi:hypothetical protein